jgi:CRISPR-associated endonuclease Csn1
MPACSSIWSFDLGKASIGEAVRDIKSNRFVHRASLLIPFDFASTKEAAKRRRMWRTRLAHKAHELWLKKVWSAAGLEILPTREVRKNPNSRKWELNHSSDYRMEREFAPRNKKPGRDGAPADETICYTSCLLRIKLLRGERLEAWQIYKALHSAIQKRGYGRVPWAAREKKRSGKSEEEIETELAKQDPNYRAAVEAWPKFKETVTDKAFHFPCYYDAWKMGLWFPDQADVLTDKINCHATSTRKVRFDRIDVNREIASLARQAAAQLPALATAFDKWKCDGWIARDEVTNRAETFPVAAKDFSEFFVHGPAGEPTEEAKNNFPAYLEFRNRSKIHPGSKDDWMGATTQKIPRFDNRIINACALIPRLQVCNVAVRFDKNENRPVAESLLVSEVTFLMKLKNTLVSGYPNQRKLTAEEIQKILIVVRAEAMAVKPDAKSRESKVAERYALTKSNWARTPGIKELGLRPLPGHEEIRSPKIEGRSRFSRSALRLIRALILSGQKPSEFHQRLLARDGGLLTEIDMDVLDVEPVRFLGPQRTVKNFIKTARPWVLIGDLKFLTDLSRDNDSWENIHLPEQRMDALETRHADEKGRVDISSAIRELLGSINDPVVRHRLEVFSERLTKLQQGDEKEAIPASGVPESIVLEFVREDFMGDRAKRDLQKFNSEREKARKEALEQVGQGSRSALLKYQLCKTHGWMCLYCGQPLKPTELENYPTEHIVPRSQGGPDAMVNYVVAHVKCNDDKGEHTPFEWLHQSDRWDAYKARVEKYATTLRNKKVQLLLREDARELVERYTALAETAWISKLAQKIASLHFGWRNGLDTEGNRRVIVISGGLTARIRRKYRLNSLLNPPPLGTPDLVQWEEKAEKNRADGRHHALDAMVINFLPQWMRDAKKGWFFRFPESVQKNPREFFEKEIADVMPRLLAFEKAPLAETIYGGRSQKGETVIVQRVPLIELGYNVKNQKKVFDRKYLAGQIKGVRDPVIAETLNRFLEKESNGESQWRILCEGFRLRKSDGMPGPSVSKVNVTVGASDEYAEMSKDGSGAYRKGKKGHKGQIIYIERAANKKGTIKELIRVRPIYAFESRRTVERQLKDDWGDAIKIYGFFQSGCLIAVDKEVAHEKLPLPTGNYLLNTIMADAKCMKVTTQNGKTYPDIPRYSLSSLINAGLRRAD